MNNLHKYIPCRHAQEIFNRKVISFRNYKLQKEQLQTSSQYDEVANLNLHDSTIIHKLFNNNNQYRRVA